MRLRVAPAFNTSLARLVVAAELAGLIDADAHPQRGEIREGREAVAGRFVAGLAESGADQPEHA